jgi:hypothetical protein
MDNEPLLIFQMIVVVQKGILNKKTSYKYVGHACIKELLLEFGPCGPFNKF